MSSQNKNHRMVADWMPSRMSDNEIEVATKSLQEVAADLRDLELTDNAASPGYRALQDWGKTP